MTAKDNTPPGSPVTAGSKDNNNGKGGTLATANNESPEKVVKGPLVDNSPATGPGDHANVAGATQDPKNPAVVKPEDALVESSKTGKAPDQTTKPSTGGSSEKQISDAELDAARDEPETPVPSQETLDKLYAEEDSEDARLLRESFNKVSTLALDVIGKDTPDSHVIWGHSGMTLTIGDLRRIGREYRKHG